MIEAISLYTALAELEFTVAKVSLMMEIKRLSMTIMLKSVQSRKKIQTTVSATEPNTVVSKDPKIIKYVKMKESKSPVVN